MSQPPSKQTAPGPSVRRTSKRAIEVKEGSSINKIRLRVNDQEGGSCEYYVPCNLPMQKILKRYCQDKNLEYLAMNFIYNGCRVHVRNTPEELHLKDGAEIDAMVHRNGGGHLNV